jgi:hypothetical protein
LWGPGGDIINLSSHSSGGPAYCGHVMIQAVS